VGQRNLRIALDAVFSGKEVKKPTIEWIPFFLNKDTPAEGYDLEEYINSKYGPGVAAQAGMRLDQAGRKVGIAFNKARRIVNTTNSHRLMEYVNQNYGFEIGDKVMENVFKAYFEEARDISRADVLVDCVSSVDIDKDSIRTFLQSDLLKKEIDEQDRRNKVSRINGVPFFIFLNQNGEKIGSLSGAQPPEVLEEILAEALE
jgi:predicted DsbA family dithiol-disulfide isomerase